MRNARQGNAPTSSVSHMFQAPVQIPIPPILMSQIEGGQYEEGHWVHRTVFKKNIIIDTSPVGNTESPLKCKSGLYCLFVCSFPKVFPIYSGLI